MSFVDYLIGCLVLAAGAVALVYVGHRLCALLVPGWRGPVAWVGTVVCSTVTALILAELLGSIGIYRGFFFFGAAVLVAFAVWRWLPDPRPDEGVDLIHVPASSWMTWIGFGVAAVAIAVFAVGVKAKLGT